jgi:hypothetical protein
MTDTTTREEEGREGRGKRMMEQREAGGSGRRGANEKRQKKPKEDGGAAEKSSRAEQRIKNERRRTAREIGRQRKARRVGGRSGTWQPARCCTPAQVLRPCLSALIRPAVDELLAFSGIRFNRNSPKNGGAPRLGSHADQKPEGRDCVPPTWPFRGRRPMLVKPPSLFMSSAPCVVAAADLAAGLFQRGLIEDPSGPSLPIACHQPERWRYGYRPALPMGPAALRLLASLYCVESLLCSRTAWSPIRHRRHVSRAHCVDAASRTGPPGGRRLPVALISVLLHGAGVQADTDALHQLLLKRALQGGFCSALQPTRRSLRLGPAAPRPLLGG